MPRTRGNPAAGELVGPFRIGRRLGVGGMGMVFAAVDTTLGRPVALKIIAPHLAEDADFRSRFAREAQAQASLDSTHVTQVYSFGEADGRLYIASQLIPDGDLGQMLHRHGAPPPRIGLSIIEHVADGLAGAHARGLVHRDVKPANVLLRNRAGVIDAFVADFGIARHDSDAGLTQVGGTVGTPTYMAPELHTGGKASAASDVYALGCLLWTVLSGQAPYAASSDYLVMRGHLERPVPQLADGGPVAAELNRVLQRALAKDPAARYATTAELRDELRHLLAAPTRAEQLVVTDEQGTELSRLAWPPPAPAPVRRRDPLAGSGTGPGWPGGWWLVGGVAVLIVIVVLLLVLAL